MKIPSLTKTDPWFAHVLQHGSAFVETVTVPVDVTVLMEQAVLEHGLAAENFRPHLRLSGRVTSVKAVGSTPQETATFGHGITESTFEGDNGPILDAIYTFTDAQLAALVTKGYFNEGFAAPESMIGIEWTLPTDSQVTLVSPSGPDVPPLVFHDIQGLEGLRLTEETCGYELVENFDVIEPEQPAFEPGDLEPFDDLEATLALEEDVFEAEQVREQAEAEQTEEELKAVRIEALYQERIAPRLAVPAPSPVSYAAYIEPGHVEEDLYEDGFLAFEGEEGAFEEGEIGFEFDPTIPEPPIEAEYDEPVLPEDVLDEIEQSNEKAAVRVTAQARLAELQRETGSAPMHEIDDLHEIDELQEAVAVGVSPDLG